MSDCRDLEPMFAPYVDGAAEPRARAEVEAHLSECPPCRDRIAVERAAHEVVHARRESLRGCASEQLRRRCAAQRVATSQRPVQPRPFIRRTLLPLSMAASLLLITGILLFGFSRQVEVLAAQLAVDHVKCFKFSSYAGARAVDPLPLSREWASARGWPVRIPQSTPEYDLVLLGMRRCGSTDGLAAHMMYRWRGTPLSVYVMNSESKRARFDEQFVETLGQEAIIWKHDGRTYAVIADAARSDLEPVVRYLKATAR